MGHSLFDALMGVLGAAVSWAVVPNVALGAEPDLVARVTAGESELRAGPSVAHRVLHRAGRGDVFVVVGRETSGYWIEVMLPDGRQAFVLGDTLEIIAATDGAELAARRPGLFAPPAWDEVHAGFALLGGVFDGEGYGEFRPAWVLAPSLSLEPYVGLALQSDRQRLLYGLSTVLNLAPDWAIAPYVELGAGGVYETPADEFIGEERRSFHARMGGGALVSLRWRIVLRLTGSNLVVFTEDSYENVPTFSLGLGTYF